MLVEISTRITVFEERICKFSSAQLYVDEHDDDLDLDLDDKDYADRLDLDLNDKDCPPFHRPGCKGLAKGTPRGQLTL